MNKKMLEFSNTDDKVDYFDELLEDFYIEVQANSLSPEEFKMVRAELESLNFLYQHIDADSIRAKFTNCYDETIAVLQELEEKGWTW